MGSEAILRIILLIVVLGIVHWGLVPMALENLVARQRVIGGRKGPWALAIVFITCLGSLLYLLIHPETQDQPY
jgi:uncharacterized membrane protein YuzA (DUF378 family)